MQLSTLVLARLITDILTALFKELISFNERNGEFILIWA